MYVWHRLFKVQIYFTYALVHQVFHKMTNSHRRFNHLRTLEVDGVVFEEASELSNQVIQFYKNLYWGYGEGLA